ncbi:MAG: site-specific integrase [Clostridiales bacterium]|nr:site-specific integrase [Clostridiales bacterium]
MATTILKKTKSGKDFIEIRVSRGRDLPPICRRWYPPEGWSKRAVQRQLDKEVAELERQVREGKVTTRREQKAKEAAEAAAKAELEARTYTVERFVRELWLPEKMQTCAASTVDLHQRNLRNWVLPVIGDIRIDQVTPPMLSKIILDVQQAGRKASTTLNIYHLLNNIFAAAEFQELISTNPVRRVKKPQPKKDDVRPDSEKALTAEQLKIVLTASEEMPLIYTTIIRVLADTGIRRGECAAIQWTDIDWESGSINIDKQLVQAKGEGYHLANTKTGKPRTVYLSKEGLHLLQRLRQEQMDVCLCVYAFVWDPLVGKPISPNTVTEKVESLGSRIGIPGLHPHTLRHTWASLAVQSGADVASVAAALGHSKPTMTLTRYTHASADGAKNAAQKFRAAMGED